MVGMKAHINVPENTMPKFYKSWPVTYTLQEPVSQELQCLQDNVSIIPAEYSDWAALIVPIVKEDKKKIKNIWQLWGHCESGTKMLYI